MKLTPLALVALALGPVIAGAVRLVGLAGGAALTPQNARFFASPSPIVLHVLSASVFCLLGAFQLDPGLRRRWPRWHRRAGRALVGCGLVAGLSGLWMTCFYPRAAGDGALLDGFRLLFGSAMVLCLVLGVAAILRRDVARHGAWMLRGYALGQGAGTQLLLSVPWLLLFGAPGELARALLLGAGWALNLAVAEWVLRVHSRNEVGRRDYLVPGRAPSP
jgi:hypothetical protein